MAPAAQPLSGPPTSDNRNRHPSEQRCEWIGGQLFAMSPSPGSWHQQIAGELYVALKSFLRHKPCRVFIAPLDVRLSADDIVQPDLLVVCDTQQIKSTHIAGPPALVIEILSPATLQHDRLRKVNLYARCGIQEYWLVTTYPGLVEVLALVDGSYRIAGTYAPEDTLRSKVLPGLELPLEPIFAFPLEGGEPPEYVREASSLYA